MFDWLMWFTRMENTKVFSLIVFFVVFCGIFLYLYTGRERGKRLESYKYMPLQDEDDNAVSADRKVK